MVIASRAPPKVATLMLLTVPITEGVSRPEAELPLLLLLLDPLEELLFEGGVPSFSVGAVVDVDPSATV